MAGMFSDWMDEHANYILIGKPEWEIPLERPTQK
jgi:hypothetical protein